VIIELNISNAEHDTLAWLTDRGYFPEDFYDNLGLQDGQPDPDDWRSFPKHEERVWEIEETHAYSLKELQREDPDAYLACLGQPLLGKILEIEQQLV
jgi:hypothetical protein